MVHIIVMNDDELLIIAVLSSDNLHLQSCYFFGSGLS